MRRVLHSDLTQLSRVLLSNTPTSRPGVIQRALYETGVADQYRLQFGMRHPQFGDGSLAGWAMTHPRAPEPRLDDPEYLHCLVLVLSALRAALLADQPDAHDTQRKAARSS